MQGNDGVADGQDLRFSVMELKNMKKNGRRQWLLARGCQNSVPLLSVFFLLGLCDSVLIQPPLKSVCSYMARCEDLLNNGLPL